MVFVANKFAGSVIGLSQPVGLTVGKVASMLAFQFVSSTVGTFWLGTGSACPLPVCLAYYPEVFASQSGWFDF